jgi:hypothetical protein
MYDGEFLWHLGSGDDSIEVPLSVEGHVVEETQCRHGNDEGAGRQLFLLGEMELVSTNLFPTQNLRRLVEMAGEERDLFQVGDLGCEGKIPNLHVLGHSRAQCCHGKNSFAKWNVLQAAVPWFRKRTWEETEREKATKQDVGADLNCWRQPYYRAAV